MIDKPRKAVVSVVEMAEMVGLSKSRFYALVQAGIFPEAVRHEACKRPVFDLKLQQKCLEIRQSGIGANGQPVLFNRKPKRTVKPRQTKSVAVPAHPDLVDALKSLGLNTTDERIDAALRELHPGGWGDLDQGELVRQLFLHLQTRK